MKIANKIGFVFSLGIYALIHASAFAASPFTISADGQEVTDARSGLIWRRCLEGMSWSEDSGTCIGKAIGYTHTNALLRAASEANASGRAWRVPTVKELSSMLDRSQITKTLPAVDPNAFPNTGGYFTWTSTPVAGSDGAKVWLICYSNGQVTPSDRSGGGGGAVVRLVRAR